eukprot:gnl/Spiro4/22560_TR11127_c4_g1_i1.p1 gnl/Spiro4/22560_TR11127_c4_g1~~gnl/Spiro4/22560_TR11127_c4_g1_i1.p1  ORF type:complete len:167 (-),score=42.91 gnl/Spiro4/22560_TR11127_c4_g1_i1:40-540(-)
MSCLMTPHEIDIATTSFLSFDTTGSRVIETVHVPAVLRAIGYKITDEEAFTLLDGVERRCPNTIDFDEFLLVFEAKKRASRTNVLGYDPDTADAFVAMGGKPDRTGDISTDKLRKTVKEFGLTIDIDQLITEYDRDSSGMIDYGEFSTMLGYPIDEDKDKDKKSTN